MGNFTRRIPPIWCTPEQEARWKAAAEADDRPLAQWMRVVMDEAAREADVDSHGVAPQSEKSNAVQTKEA